MRAEPVDDVIVHREDGEAFLLHVGSGRYFGLNRAGLVVWEALGEGRDPADALREEWPELEPQAATADAGALVERLVAAGLARAVDAAPG